MADNPDDTAVDRAIAHLEGAVSELRSSQKKDEEDEDTEISEETPREKQPRTVREAAVRVREHFRGRKHASPEK